ncbi:heavy metal sensor histidine kinase [Actimicrobium antarcticum]|uniref:Sensor protein n=1 Tax=Actimicrobium antarcticum TaxID=1051899 RepID=A0ABP7SHS2_9BURK
MRNRSISITSRLAILFASVTMVTFAAVGIYLYDVLAQQLERGDDVELIGKTSLVRHLLLEAGSIAAIGGEPHPFVDAVFGHEGLILSLKDKDGRLLVMSRQPSKEIPEMIPVPASRNAEASDVHDWRTAVGTGRFVSILGAVGDPGHTPVTITIAREGSDRSAMLAEYAENLFFAVMAGSTLAAVLGFFIVRVGMRPLRQVIIKANEISTHQLNTRLSTDDTPLELRELGLAFNAMLNRLEDGVRRLSQFAADIAHDLRTPINTLLVETQVILSGLRTPDEYQAVLVSNIEEYERLARLVENTLFLARADNAQLALRPEVLDMPTELGKICDYFEGIADEADVRLDVASNDVQLQADRVLFRRAVSNLVSNAISHSPRGSAINIRAVWRREYVEISVSNNGSPIPAVHLPHIFERFYRVDPARSFSTHSSGLGLAIVRAIMVLHGGDALVESKPGASTVFRLRFMISPDTP